MKKKQKMRMRTEIAGFLYFCSMGVELLASRKQLDVAGSVTDFYLFL
ncbi:hypothetical protein [Prevotella jejuni]